MFIEIEDWIDLKKSIANMYWDEDRLSPDGIYFLKGIEDNIKEIEKKTKSEVYIISTNCVIDDEISNGINDVTLSLREAKEIFRELVDELKDDMDYDLLDIVNIEDVDLNTYEGWVVDSGTDYFSIFYNGEYNSNNMNIYINKFDLSKDKYKDVDEENMEVN